MSDHADDDTKKEALSTHFLDSDDDDEKQMRGNGREENDDDAFLAKYDSDGYGDEADRAQLMQMNELDREEELAKRSAKLKILKDRKRILEKAKEREEKERLGEGTQMPRTNGKQVQANFPVLVLSLSSPCPALVLSLSKEWDQRQTGDRQG